MKEIKDLGFGIIQVNGPKPTISKMESVDNYLCKWQKLKEWLNKEADHVRYTPYDCRSLSSDFELWHLNKILDKMQELEAKDE